MELECFELEIKDHIAHVRINRPDKANSLNEKAWEEMVQIFQHISDNPDARVAVLSGNGKYFCAGIDLSMLMNMQRTASIKCDARKREVFRKDLLHLQSAVSSVEHCSKPVLAAIHSGCIGGGVDIVTACDMRYCSEDAYFTVKEVDMGLVADIGTMQRLPKIIPPAMAAEMAYTGRKVHGPEAAKLGLVNHVASDKDALMAYVLGIATSIASKSPVVIRGTKEILLHTRDHSVPEGLNYMSVWNAAMFYSKDLEEAFAANMERRPAVYKEG